MSLPLAADPRPCVLGVGHAVHATGYARVLGRILRELEGPFKVVQFGVNYHGPSVESGHLIEPNRLLGDRFGVVQMEALLWRHAPSALIVLHDAWFADLHFPAVRRYRTHGGRDVKVFVYCPIEWEEKLPHRLAHLVEADRVVAFNEFGRRVIRDALDRLGEPLSGRLRLDVIAHGVDADRFRPLAGASDAIAIAEGRRAARAMLFPHRPELRDAFIVLNANRNAPRKRIDLTLESFAAFAASKHDAYLYLHMGMRDTGVNVLALARRLGVIDRLLLTTDGPDKPEVPDTELNLIYNACDVGLNTSTGEGWGLVAFEHAAAGAAQIVPDHSACAELWKAVGLLAPVHDGAVGIAGVVAHLDAVYSDRNRLFAATRAAFVYATSARFRWAEIGKQWNRCVVDECDYVHRIPHHKEKNQ